MQRSLSWGLAVLLAVGTAFAAAPADARDHRDGHRGHDRGRGWDDRRGHDRRHDRRDDRRYDRGRDHAHHRGHRGRDHVYYVPARPVVHYRPVPRHVGPPPWARGRYVHHYSRPVYVVRDYRGYGLRHPPRGYHWMRDDYGDYLMVAVATGLIADLVLHR